MPWKAAPILVLLCAVMLAGCHSQRKNSPAPMTSAEHLKAIQQTVTSATTRPNPAALNEIRSHLSALKPLVSTDYDRLKLQEIDELAEALFAHPAKYPNESKDLTDSILFNCRMLEGAFSSP